MTLTTAIERAFDAITRRLDGPLSVAIVVLMAISLAVVYS